MHQEILQSNLKKYKNNKTYLEIRKNLVYQNH